MRPRLLAPLVAVLLPAVPTTAPAAVKPGLEGAQELFRQNRWADARSHLLSQWGSLPEKDRPAATFLVGRSYVREAEFHRAVRRVEIEVGLAYLEELASAKANRGVAWIRLFEALYQLEEGRHADAERGLRSAGQTALPPTWKATARLRRAVALHRLGRAAEAAAALKDPSPEGRFWKLLLHGAAEVPPATPREDRNHRLLRANLLFRASRSAEADAVLSGVSLDPPDAQDATDPKKVFRFHDPLLARAWERVCWERAAAALKPLAAGGTGTEKSLAAQYLGTSLFHLGVPAQSLAVLEDVEASSLGPDLKAVARLLLAASSWRGRAPSAAELASLWEGTQAQPDAVLLWDELRRGDLSKVEPFATRLDARLRGLLESLPARPTGALVGRWGLARLRLRDDPAALAAALSEHRDKSNKNKLEWNDPLLLLALSAADYRDQEYAQALETLFELSKTFQGLRALQWNLQGIYAARQKAGGEARISQ